MPRNPRLDPFRRFDDRLMYHHITGKVVSLAPTRAVLEAAGVGYELAIPLSSYRALKDESEATLLTHFWVREDQQRLFGFVSEAERQVFRVVVTVSGIGPAIALAILSSYTVEDFCRIIEEGDPGALQRIKGVGRKIAERLMVELRDRLPAIAASADLEPSPEGGRPSPHASEAVSEATLALVELGFSRKDAEKRVELSLKKLASEEDVAPGTARVEQILTLALRAAP